MPNIAYAIRLPIEPQSPDGILDGSFVSASAPGTFTSDLNDVKIFESQEAAERHIRTVIFPSFNADGWGGIGCPVPMWIAKVATKPVYSHVIEHVAHVYYVRGASDADRVQAPTQVGWRIFNGEGSYEFVSYQDNEDYAERYIRRNGPKYESWIEPVFTLS